MPTNLSIENLSRIVEVGDSEGLLKGNGPAQEARVSREMRLNGMNSPVAGSGDRTFTQALEESFEKVNLHQHQADRAIKELVAGRSKNIHETLLTIERADASLKLAMQVRNKILDAYREIMRMQV